MLLLHLVSVIFGTTIVHPSTFFILACVYSASITVGYVHVYVVYTLSDIEHMHLLY